MSNLIFALLFTKDGLPDSIMVVRQILVLFVEVRILVGQRSNSETSIRYFYFGIWIPTCGRDFEISKLGKKFVEATA